MKKPRGSLVYFSAFLLILLFLATTHWGKVEKLLDSTFGIIHPAHFSNLVVGTNLWIGYESFYLARNLGYYDNTGVRFVEHLAATQQIREFRNRAIQAAALTLDEVLLFLEHGHDLRVVLVIDISNGGDVIIGKPELKNFRDLRGHRIAVENTAVGGYMITRALEISGMTLDEITVVPLQVNELERAFLEGNVDAVVTFEPMKSRLLAQGSRLLFDSSQIPGEIIDVLIVTKETLESHSDHVETLLEGWFRALKYYQINQKDAAQRMSKRLRISPQEVMTAFQGMELPSLSKNLNMMTGSSPLILETAQQIAKHMVKAGLLQEKVDLYQFLEPGLLERLKVRNPEFQEDII